MVADPSLLTLFGYGPACHEVQVQPLCLSLEGTGPSAPTKQDAAETGPFRFPISPIFPLINQDLTPKELDAATYNVIGRHVLVHPARGGPFRADSAPWKCACSPGCPSATRRNYQTKPLSRQPKQNETSCRLSRRSRLPDAAKPYASLARNPPYPAFIVGIRCPTGGSAGKSV